MKFECLLDSINNYCLCGTIGIMCQLAKQESVILCYDCAIQMILALTYLPSVSLQGRDR